MARIRKVKKSKMFSLAEMQDLCPDCAKIMSDLGLKEIDAGVFLEIEAELKNEAKTSQSSEHPN